MTENTICPVNGCSFEGSIRDISAHIQKYSNEGHTREELGYEDADEFQYETHLELGNQLKKDAQQARDLMEFETAINDLEGVFWHSQPSGRLVKFPEFE